MSIDSLKQVEPASLPGTPAKQPVLGERVKFFHYLGEEILLVDFSHADVPTVKAVAEKCRMIVATRPALSVRTLVDVNGTAFDKETIQVGGELAKHNRPYVRRSAVTGVTGLRQIAFNAIVTLAKRDMRVCRSREEALGWLISHD